MTHFTIKGFLWRVESYARRMRIRNSSNKRPSSKPYITGDGFREMADHIYDSSEKLDPSRVRENDLIFVQSDVIEDYFRTVHTIISVPYRLITHNSDKNITEKEASYIDEKIIHWFAQNAMIKHPKITPLPIGLENAHYANAGHIRLFEIKKPVNKNGRIMLNFSLSTNPEERRDCLDSLSPSPLADMYQERLPQPEYIKMLSKYSAVASPSGNGIDCHRTWEALYVGTIPIVRPSPALSYFASLGLPVWIEREWKNIIALSGEDLSLKYDTLMRDASFDALSMDFWAEKIRGAK